MGFFGAIKNAFSKAKSATSKARGYFPNDPFHTDDLMSKARQKIGIDDEEGESKVQKIIKSIGPEEEKSFSATVEDIVAEETSAKLDEKADDVQNVEKQGFFNKMLKNLPGAVGVLIAKDPGKALIQVLQSRTDYLVEQERQDMRTEEQKRLDAREEKRLALEEKKLKEQERHAKQTETFNDMLLDMRERVATMEEGGRNLRAENELAYRTLDSERRLLEGLSGQANRRTIAQMQIEGSAKVAAFNASATANLKTTLANMASDAEREQWARDAKWTLTMAGGGDREEAGRDAENLVNKMLVGGMDSLTEGEMALIESAKAVELDNDAMRKEMMLVGRQAVTAAMKPRWQTDPDTGEQSRLPGLSQAETDQIAAQAVNSFAVSMGVESPVHFGPNPTMTVEEQQAKHLETLKIAVGGMTPDAAWSSIQDAVTDGYVTQEQADSLGYSDPKVHPATKMKTGERVPGAGAMANFAPPTAP
jgi:hypothetical protein